MPVGVYPRNSNMKTGKHMVGRTPWNKGKTNIYTEETLNNIGKNNPNYKGGVSTGDNRKPYVDSYNHEYRRKLRAKTLEVMGNKCVKCGFDDARALQIDHVKGGGHKERKEQRFLGGGKTYHLEVIASVESGEGKYQLLCANCNWIKRSENNELANYLANS